MSWKIPLTVTKYLKSQPSTQEPEVRCKKPHQARTLPRTLALARIRSLRLWGDWAAPHSPALPFPQPAWVPVLRRVDLNSGKSNNEARWRWPKKAADVTLRFRSAFFDVWPSQSRQFLVDCTGLDWDRAAHGMPMGLPTEPLPLPPVFLCMPTMHTVPHLLSDDPNGKALSVLSSSLPLSMNPRATCHYIRYLTCLHVDYSMFREPRLVYLPYVPKTALASRLLIPCRTRMPCPVLSLPPYHRASCST